MSVIDKIQINSTTYDVAVDAGNVAYSDAATYPDGSAGKEISQLKSEIMEIYVTPEMFGAVGDGVADDTVALQSAFDSDYPVYSRFGGVYKTSDSITLSKAKSLNLHGTIAYSGTDYAIVIDGIRLSDVDVCFGSIVASNGSGVQINVAQGYYVAGVNFSGGLFYCKDIGIEVNANYWFNENYFENFNFNICETAILITCLGNQGQAESLKFFKCHFEGITNGVHVISNGKDVDNYRFYGCRMYEPPQGKYIWFEGIPSNKIYAQMCYIYDYVNPLYVYGVLACVFGTTIYTASSAMKPTSVAYIYDGKSFTEGITADKNATVVLSVDSPEITMTSYEKTIYIPVATTGTTFIVNMNPEVEGVYLDINRQMRVKTWERANTLRVIINGSTYNFSLAGKAEFILHFNFQASWACLT